MRALVLGAGGQLGRALAARAPEGVSLETLARADLDITDEGAVMREIRHIRPRLVFNAAAYTDVDGAEDDPRACFHVNADGARAVARACKEVGARLVHVSTDFVFAGDKETPYTEEDRPNPRGVYAESKAEGERLVAAAGGEHLIVRTSWLYGEPPARTFPHRVLEWAKSRETIELARDHYGSPTYAPYLARALWRLGEAKLDGTLHWAGGGKCSRYELGAFLISCAHRLGAVLKVKEIIPVPAEKFPLKAPRPQNSSLASVRLEREYPELQPSGWKRMIQDFAAEWVQRTGG